MPPSTRPSSRPAKDGPRALRPAWAWTGEELVRAPVIVVEDDGRLRPHRGEPVEDIGGLLLPGFVNAHVHLELGPVRFPPGVGLPGWVPMVRSGPPPSVAQAGQGAFATIRAGTAAVGEVSNTQQSTAVVTSARLAGRVFHEVIGIDVDALPEGVGPLPVPHAPHTTHPAVIQACAARGGPWTIHFDEDPDEALFLVGRGAWPALMASFGRDLSRFTTPYTSPARYLADLEVLSERALLVHATCTRGDDLDVVAASGARVALCPRSNLALTRRLPDVDGLVARGVRLAIGTDSLASSPDLDPLAEAVALRTAFPHLPLTTWLTALTAGGADALALPLGRLVEGQAPGLVHVAIDSPEPLEALLDGTPWRRRWLACPLP